MKKRQWNLWDQVIEGMEIAGAATKIEQASCRFKDEATKGRDHS
jgi:hypothetical protein